MRRMLQEWTGTKIGSSKARRVWDLVRHTVPDKADLKSEVTQTDKGPLDKVIQSQGVKIKTLDELLAFCEVDTDVWRVKSYKVNSWQSGMKTPKGPRVVQLFQVKAELERKLLPSHQPIRVRVTGPKVPKNADGPIRRVCILPDPQVGLMWALPKYDALSPTHDPKALDLAVQAIREFKPDAVVCLGDLLDACEWGSYPHSPAHRQTTQPALAVTAHWLASIRAAAPEGSEVYICEGNHDARLRKQIQASLPQACGVSAPGDGLEALDIRRLLGLDELDIEWVATPYTKSFYLWDRIRCIHGSIVRGKAGQTVAAIATDAIIDTVMGHIHKREMCSKVIWGPDGPKTIQVMSPGCLTSTTGNTPGRTLEPSWTQAIGFAEWHVESDHLSMWSVPIIDGRMLLNGRVLYGDGSGEEVAKATGYHQLIKGYEDGQE